MDVRGKARSLDQLRYLREEVDLLSQRIAELELAARGGAGRITGLPRCALPAAGEWGARLAALRDRLENRRERCMMLLGELYAFIDDVDDSLMRQILTYRYIDGDTWQRVARRIGEADEQYPRLLHNRFLERARVPVYGELDENDAAGALYSGQNQSRGELQ